MEKVIKQKQIETIKCSFFYMPMILILLIVIAIGIRYFGILEVSFFTLIPISIAIILIPFQAMFFDLFNTSSQYFTFLENDLLEIKLNNEALNELQKTKYRYEDIVNIELKFRQITCLETITIKFKNEKELQFINFYFSNDDFKWMKKFFIETLQSRL